MIETERPIIIATRGSALALVQANAVLAQCRNAFPRHCFDIKIIKTTGDKMQSASLINQDLPKGLFTKELESALLCGEADMAVHSLKDLPTDLPEGLTLGAVGKRVDARDVLIYRDAAVFKPDSGKRTFKRHVRVSDLPDGARIATSSTRRSAQLLLLRPDLKIQPIRGNVPTRLKKLAEQAEMDATVLAAAGLHRLGFTIDAEGRLLKNLGGEANSAEALAPPGLLATVLDPQEMLPCVGQAAIGIEVRQGDRRLAAVCEKLNDAPTQLCVTAERAFLKGMGGGCQVPVAGYAEIAGDQLWLRVVSFLGETVQRAEGRRPVQQAEELGFELAERVGGKGGA